jgi:hypothetical protein
VDPSFKGGIEMKKSIFLAFCLVIFSLVPSLSSAECTQIGGFNKFSSEGSTVVLYFGQRPIVRFDLQGCSVQPSSKIQLIKNDVCDGDEIMIDGEKCIILEIKPF